MNSRRSFLKIAVSLAAIPTVMSLGKVAFAQEKKKKKGDAGAAGGEIGWAVPGKGAAATIQYVEDRSKVAKAAQVAKSGIPFEKQNCANCILFVNGLCTIITDNNKKVKPAAWCPTWTHNPAVKS